MTLNPTPPTSGPSKDSLRAEHKKFLARPENEGRIFGAGKLENAQENEQTDMGFGRFILRADSRRKAEQIAFQEPYTTAGHRAMRLIPWQRTEGDISIQISFTNGTMTIDRRSFVFGGK